MKTVIWQVRRINTDGVYDPHKRWLVAVERDGRSSESSEAIQAEIAKALQSIRDDFHDEDDPIEDEKWSLTPEIVEFEYGKGTVATL